VSAVEGTPWSGTVAEFDLDCTGGGECPDASELSARIAWGDNARSSTGAITRTFSPDNSTATYTVSGTHTYMGVSGKSTLTVSVAIFDDVLEFTGDAWVANAPIAASVDSFDIPAWATITGPLLHVADPGGQPLGIFGMSDPTFQYSMTLDWGDGTPAASGLTLGQGTRWDIRQAHRYTRFGTYTIHFHIQDPGGSQATATGTVVVEPLTVSLAAKRVQHLRAGNVAVTVTPTLAASLQARGTVSVPGVKKAFRLVGMRHIHTDHDKAVTVQLPLPAPARRAARAALRRHKHVIARVQIDATSSLRIGYGRQRLKTSRRRRVSLVP
jgi:hypothetical protein